jgi:hypothetical protein
MTPADAAELLAYAAAFDNRSTSEIAARAWAEALDPRVLLADGRRVVVEHYARTREWIMPSDINTAATRLRRERLDRMATPEPPESLDGDPALEIPWQRAYRAAIGDGHDEQRADEIACATVGVRRPAVITAVRPVAQLVAQAADSLPRIPRHTDAPRPPVAADTKEDA